MAADPMVVVADALECFWNASIGSARNSQDPTALAIAGALSEGFAAIAARLREGASLDPTLPAGVDAVERSAKIAEAQVSDAIGDDDAAKAYRMACYDCAEAIRSALSPATTPVSEADR